MPFLNNPIVLYPQSLHSNYERKIKDTFPVGKKSINLGLFVLTVMVLGPILVVAAVIGLGWWWEGFTRCFWASPYSTCGYGEFTRATIFSIIAIGCFTGIQKMWNKTK